MGGHTQRPWTPTKRRGPIAAEYQSPGPACVSLPTSIGPGYKAVRAPAFSFGSRHNNKNDSPGPGPGQYNVTGLSSKGRDSPPSSTLHGRPKEIKGDQTPAPGDYNPEKGDMVTHDHSPMYTFGHKTQHEKPSDTPAPNSYNIPAAMGTNKEGNKNSPSFTISGRQKEMTDDRILTPGPGTYNNSSTEQYKSRRSPSYSISARYQIPSDSTQKPGPGAHSPEKVTINQSSAPSHSFGIRHSPYIAQPTPRNTKKSDFW